jgi:uncharacterized protein (TIGR00369 family)
MNDEREIYNLEKSKKQGEKIIDLLKQAINKPLSKYPIPPFTKWLNGIILEVERGFIKIQYNARNEMANPANILHGGAQAAMLDDTIGITCATLGYKNFLMTVDLRIDYLGRIPIDEDLIVEGKVVREGKTIIHAEAKTFIKSSNLVAVAHSNLLKVDVKPNYNKNPIYDKREEKTKI